MRVLTVIGNRPQFVKAAAVSRLLRAEHDELLVHTGQHHDDELSTIFVTELGIPRPERELGIHGGTNTEQTARMLAVLGPLVAEERPDAVLVYGDTNSTLAGGLAAAQARVPVAHVEAGMRSFDRAMPEELNRVLTDHLSDVLLCPSPTAVANLEREHVAGRDRARRRRDGRRGAALRSRARGPTTARCARRASARASTRWPPRTARATSTTRRGCARWSTCCSRCRCRSSCRCTRAPARASRPPAGWASSRPPRTSACCRRWATSPSPRCSSRARAVLTDSGGVQKEAYLAGVPCVTMRDTTEWVETVDVGWNVLVDLDAEAALAALERTPPAERPELYGDGRAGARVVAALAAL